METRPPVIVPSFGDVCIRRMRRKRQKRLLIDLCLDFAKNTTLHGLRYVTEKGLHIIEKVFWFVTFFASASMCFYFIYESWEKWQKAPVIVSFNSKNVFADEVPFPSVTICPNVQFLQKVFNYTKVWDLASDDDFNDKNNTQYRIDHDDEVRTANILSLLCDIRATIEHKDNSKNLNVTALNKIRNVSVFANHDETFEFFLWRDKDNVLLKSVWTKSGLCLNFNGLMNKDILSDDVQDEFNYTSADTEIRNWTMDGGYTSKSADDAFPYFGSRTMYSFVLILPDIDNEKDKRCNGLYSGYKVFLHHPADLPQALTYHFSVVSKQVSSMGIKFTMETADPALKKYSIETRQCYFPEERPLRFFRIYTYNNCMLECLTNGTFKECGCVAYYMPYNDSTKICSADTMMTCRAFYEEEFITESTDICKCLPLCNFIHYDADVHKREFILREAQLANKIISKDDNNTYSDHPPAMELFYKQPTYRTVHRSELYGFSDFLGDCGGLLGLFIGFSWLSLVEVFYFLTFRIYRTLRKDLKDEKDELATKQADQRKNE